MFTRLTIKNFRSLGEVTLELAPYTVIVGQNRAGKSNILRALRALFTNQTGDDFIRQGQTSCTVEVETEEGFVVRWVKAKDGASYTIIHEGEEDRVFTKLAGQVPPEVTEVLGIRGVEVDATTTIWPQVHQQGEFAFLIKPHLTSGQAARAIARLTKLDVVVKAQQSCKATLREANSALKEARTALQRSDKEMDEFRHLAEEKSFLEAAQQERKRLGEAIGRYVAGVQALRDYDGAKAASDLFIPNPEDLAELETRLDTLLDVCDLLEIVSVTPPGEVPDIDELRVELYKLLDAATVYDCLCKGEEELGNLNIAAAVLFGEQKQIELDLEKLSGEECPVCGGTL